MEKHKISQMENAWIHLKQINLLEDIVGMAYIQPLLKDSFLPFSNSSLRPFNLACILNDIVINRRSNILEFGSGLSTIILGRLIKLNHLNSKIISVDHDKEWINFIQEYINRENLGEIISLILAPLKDYKMSLNKNKWYDKKELVSINKLKFDMAIIDGPPAWEPQNHEARYPAIHFLKNKLAEKYVIYLDDVEREGESNIILKWEKEFNLKFRIAGGTLAYYAHGTHFNTII